MFEFVITRELAKQFAYDCFDEIIKDIKESKQLKNGETKEACEENEEKYVA